MKRLSSMFSTQTVRALPNLVTRTMVQERLVQTSQRLCWLCHRVDLCFEESFHVWTSTMSIEIPFESL